MNNLVPFSRIAMLMGSPRSGTTWLAKIIDSDPTILYRHEPDSINVRPDIPFVPEMLEFEANMSLSRDYVQELVQERRSKSSGSQPIFRKSYRSLAAEEARRLIVLGAKVGERMPGMSDWCTSLQIPDLVSSRSDASRMVFIKSVSSLCRTKMFSLACPDMRFIHILRHPCAYVASTLRGKKLGLLSDDAYIETLANMPEASEFGLTFGVLKKMSRIEQLAARWMLQNSKVISEMSDCDQYMPVIYEELCAQPLSVVEGLFTFLGLTVTDQTRQFIQASTGSKSDDVRYFDVKRDSGKAATGWMSELTEEQIQSVKGVVSGSEAGRLYFPE